MRINQKHFWLLCIVLLAFQTAFGQYEIAEQKNLDISVNQTDLRIENLRKQIKELFEAYNKCDVGKYVEWAHPNNFEEKQEHPLNFLELVQFIFETNSEAHKFSLSPVENTNQIIELNEQLFSIIPFKLEVIKDTEKKEYVKLGSLIGISEDNGKSWKFVNGLAFNKLFPDVAGFVPIPEEKLFVNGVEQ